MSTLREKLEALATGECNGTSEYRDCAVHSRKAQVMARMLLLVLDGATVDEGGAFDHALDRAENVRPENFG